MKKGPLPNAARPVCFTLLLCALVYGLILPFCWGNDPSDTYGTLSLLCENRIGYFWVWALLTGLGLAVNLEYLFRKYAYNGVFLRVAVIFALVGMILTAATLNHSIQNWNPKRVAHWIGAICYGAGLAVAFLFFFLGKAREYKRFIPFLALIVCTLAGIGIQMLTVGRNGYMEILPMALLELILLVLNFTPLAPVHTKTAAVPQKA